MSKFPKQHFLAYCGAYIDTLTNAVNIDVVVLSAHTVVVVGRTMNSNSVLSASIILRMDILTRSGELWAHNSRLLRINGPDPGIITSGKQSWSSR